MPVELEPLPQEASTATVAEEVAELPDVPVASAAEKIQFTRRRPRTVAPANAAAGANAAPPQAAATDVPEAEFSAIGDLTTGGEATPQTRQEAVDLIETTDKRLKALGSSVVSSHRSLIGKVKNFNQQAQRALASGDAEGAKTLALKGKLLLDDLLK
jgi:hypothetical protein